MWPGTSGSTQGDAKETKPPTSAPRTVTCSKRTPPPSLARPQLHIDTGKRVRFQSGETLPRGRGRVTLGGSGPRRPARLEPLRRDLRDPPLPRAGDRRDGGAAAHAPGRAGAGARRVRP